MDIDMMAVERNMMLRYGVHKTIETFKPFQNMIVP